MKILICGCGDIGETLARELGAAGYDLTIMDSNAQVLESGINHTRSSMTGLISVVLASRLVSCKAL